MRPDSRVLAAAKVIVDRAPWRELVWKQAPLATCCAAAHWTEPPVGAGLSNPRRHRLGPCRSVCSASGDSPEAVMMLPPSISMPTFQTPSERKLILSNIPRPSVLEYPRVYTVELYAREWIVLASENRGNTRFTYACSFELIRNTSSSRKCVNWTIGRAQV